MKFRKIQFKNTETQKMYEDYIKQILSVTKALNKDDQNDILMELNSHIYESMSKSNDELIEVQKLKDTIRKIGVPHEILKPLVAEKKLSQATKTFNPIHIFQALILNFSYGVIYIIFFILYLFLFSFIILVIGKILYPEHVGFYFKKGEIFQYGGFVGQSHLQKYEILGDWFIPVTLLLGVIFYFIISLLLKLKKSLKEKDRSQKIALT